ncbi:Sterile alpha motif, type 2 [Cucumis melo var. makuwa]|uniref:Uncharacterized protein LOC103487398 n=2 Tax=Cucumis melo TaxID=3656 RepID=A0A1S3B951_CUCME|nr:uncharacterized protein LOC103487398 [Cucumis melo]KAA0050059.1 Sterile alpha motif, type 2 [Cucumis melo var. makuwa]
MDWFSWLSRTGLDPLHTYEYGLLFARNALKPEDIPRFNHHFLQKIGISIAKHRLEILKLAKSHTTHQPNLNNPLISAFFKTKICLRNCLRRLISPSPAPDKPIISPEPPPSSLDEPKVKVKEVLKPPRRRSKHVSLSGPLDRTHEKFVMSSKSLKLSGPLDRKERPPPSPSPSPLPPMFPRSPRTSGPLDGRISDWGLSNKSPKVNGPPQGRMMRLIPPSRSPRVSGPLDGRDGSPRICCRCNRERMESEDDYHSLWVSLFYDMKPT